MSPDAALEAVIDSEGSERTVLEWLKKKENAWILPQALAVSQVAPYAVPEFPFGTDYRADFVIMVPFLADSMFTLSRWCRRIDCYSRKRAIRLRVSQAR